MSHMDSTVTMIKDPTDETTWVLRASHYDVFEEHETSQDASFRDNLVDDGSAGTNSRKNDLEMETVQ